MNQPNTNQPTGAIIINMVKAADKKHSVQFKPETEADKKFCSAFYLARPASDTLDQIAVTVTAR